MISIFKEQPSSSKYHQQTYTYRCLRNNVNVFKQKEKPVEDIECSRGSIKLGVIDDNMISRKARTDNGKVSVDLESDTSSNPDFPRKAVFLLMIIFAHTSRRLGAQSTHERTDVLQPTRPY